MSGERRKHYSWKKDFKFTTKKTKAGEVSVAELRSGFRTLTINGKVKTSSNIFSSSFIFSTLKQAGVRFLGFFPFLKQEKSTFITTYSIPTTYTKARNVYLCYDYTFTIADNTPSEQAIQSVLKKIGWLGEQISLKIEDAIVCMKDEQF